MLAQTKRRGLTHSGLLGRGTDERERGKHLQSKPVAGYILLHRNHSQFLFRQCATRLSVAVLDIAFQSDVNCAFSA